MENVTLLNVFNCDDCKIDEYILWSILSSGAKLIEDKRDIKKYPEFLMTIENVVVCSNGQLKLNVDSSIKYSKNYFAPEIVDLKHLWNTEKNENILKVLIFSFGITIQNCLQLRKSQYSLRSNTLLQCLHRMTESNANNRLTLSELLQTCSEDARLFTAGKSFGYYLMNLFQSYESATEKLKMIRSKSSSAVCTESMKENEDVQKSTANISQNSMNNSDKMLSPKRSFKLHIPESSSGSISCHNSSSSLSQPQTDSDTDSCKGLSHRPNYENLLLNSFDQSEKFSKQNITAIMERMKARSKCKHNGPVKSPGTNMNHCDGIDCQSSQKDLFTSPKSSEKSMYTKLSGLRSLLGPEFMIRKNEILYATLRKQRKESMFSRSNSGRLLHTDVLVHFLNGTSMHLRNVNKRNTIGHIITLTQTSVPDLEFVNYGFAINLDNEYFFVKEETNVQKLSQYLFQRHKARAELMDDRCLHLYYRVKFYPDKDSLAEMQPFNRRLLYLQLRQDLLFRNIPPVDLIEAQCLAGLAVHAEYGGSTDNEIRNEKFLKLENYFSATLSDQLDVPNETAALKSYQSRFATSSWEDAEIFFIHTLMNHKYYGMHWYGVNKNQMNFMGALAKQTSILVGRQSIQLVDVNYGNARVQIYSHFCYKWHQIDSISVKQRKLIIKPKMRLKMQGVNANSVFTCLLDSRTKAQYIVMLCNQHHLIASPDEVHVNSKFKLNPFPSFHRRSSSVDYPLSVQTSVDFSEDDSFVDYASSDEDSCNLSQNEPQSRGSGLQRMKNLRYAHHRISQNTSSEDTEQDRKEDNKCNGNRSSMKDIVDGHLNTLKEDETDNIKLKTDNIHEVTLIKNGSHHQEFGIGITAIKTEKLQGTFVKCISNGSIAYLSQEIHIGDEILCINGRDVTNLSKKEVSETIKCCGNSVKFLVKHHFLNELPNLDNGSNESNSVTTSQNSDVEDNIQARNFHFSFKKNSDFRNVLLSHQVFGSFLKSDFFDSYLPSIKDSNFVDPEMSMKNFVNFIHVDISNLEQLVNTKRHSNSVSNGSSSYSCNLEIDLNRISKDSLFKRNIIHFKILTFPTTENSNENFWNQIINSDSRFVVSFNTEHSLQSNNKSFFYYNGVGFINEEECEVNEYCSIRRLSVPTGKSSDNLRIFHIHYFLWPDDEKGFRSILKTINLVCGICTNYPESNTITIYSSNPNNICYTFIALYVELLLGLYSTAPIAAITENQTIVYNLFHQIISQESHFVLEKDQYHICMSILRQLTSQIRVNGNFK